MRFLIGFLTAGLLAAGGLFVYHEHCPAARRLGCAAQECPRPGQCVCGEGCACCGCGPARPKPPAAEPVPVPAQPGH